MSSLPTIDQSKVASRLVTKLSEVISQSTQLEILAEALRDERDDANRKLNEALSKIKGLEAAQMV